MSFKEDFGKVPLCNHRADRGIYIHGFCLPLCAMVAPTAVDGAAEYFAGKESNNRRRLITGVFAGAGCAIIEKSIIDLVRKY